MRSRQTTLTVILAVGVLALAGPAGVQAFSGDASRQATMVMQRCLTSLGYETGGVTGTWNTQTETMAYRYASSKDLNPYTDGYRVGQLLILDCATRAVQLNDQTMLAEISQSGATPHRFHPASPWHRCNAVCAIWALIPAPSTASKARAPRRH